MTDTTATENTPFFQFQRAYLKGVSLELPHAPQIFLEPGELKLDLQMANTSQELSPNVYEVSLRGTLTGKLGEKVVYLLEAEYAGIFEIRNVPQPDLTMVMEINCPSILTPYLRTQLSDTLLRASLPAFLLPEINWMQSYADRQSAVQEAAEAAKH